MIYISKLRATVRVIEFNEFGEKRDMENRFYLKIDITNAVKKDWLN